MRIYSCGPTVYSYQHIGNMRAYVFTDTLSRVLSYSGLALTHVINITDVGHLTSDADTGEDKLEKAANREGRSALAIAKHYTEVFWRDIDNLNIRAPSRWAFATDHVHDMISFARKIAPVHCYLLDTGLYFDTSTVSAYGSLARSEAGEVQGRIEEVPGKRNPGDFAIWRLSKPGERRQLEWDSPWGRGAPGWHLECSVMSMKYLGEQFDIHTGGLTIAEFTTRMRSLKTKPTPVAAILARLSGCITTSWSIAAASSLNRQGERCCSDISRSTATIHWLSE